MLLLLVTRSAALSKTYDFSHAELLTDLTLDRCENGKTGLSGGKTPTSTKAGPSSRPSAPQELQQR
jgi:hypothetical protein